MTCDTFPEIFREFFSVHRGSSSAWITVRKWSNPLISMKEKSGSSSACITSTHAHVFHSVIHNHLLALAGVLQRISGSSSAHDSTRKAWSKIAFWHHGFPSKRRLPGPTYNVKLTPPIPCGVDIWQHYQAPVSVLNEPYPGKKNLAGAVEYYLLPIRHAASSLSYIFDY